MYRLPKNSGPLFVVRFWIAATLCLSCGVTLAGQVVGTIIKLSGPLKVEKNDGSVKVLVIGDQVEQGDTLMTGEKNVCGDSFH